MLSKYLYNLLFILSNILFPVVTFSWAARVLGPEGIGKVQVVLNFAQYFVLIAALGIPAYGMREVAKVVGDPTKLSRLFSELLVINLLTTFVLCTIYFIVISSIGWFQPDIHLYYLGGALVLSGFLTIDWFYTGSEQFRYLSLRSVIIKSISLVALILFVRTPHDLIIYLFINVLATITTNLWNLLNLPVKIKIRLRKLELRKHMPGLLILFGTTLVISMYTVMDILLLGFLTDNRSVGFYTAAIKISKIMIPLIASLGVVLIPKITRSLAEDDMKSLNTLTGQSFAFICLLGVPVSAGLLVFAPEIMLLFSGSGFTEAIPVMQMTSALALIIGLGHLFGLQLLVPGGYEKKYLYATILGMITSLVINLTLIPVIREKGAALAIVLSEAVVTGMAWYYVKKLLPLKFNWSLILNAVLACLVFIPVAILLRKLIPGPVLRLTLAVVVSAGFYFLIQIAVFREKHVREAALLLVNNWLR
ncbi:MAG: flippase [Bacteroidales bacterium]